jgi:hypothetical protein
LLVPDPRQHADRRNIIESILRYIPGFRGYLEKEYRRESDQLARTWIADRLQTVKRSLDDYSRGLVDQGKFEELPVLERLRTRLDGLMSTIRGDVRGYSSFFDYVRINEAVLDQVYDHDMSLLRDVEALLENVRQLQEKPDTPRGVVADIGQRIQELQDKYQRRRDLLAGIAG